MFPSVLLMARGAAGVAGTMPGLGTMLMPRGSLDRGSGSFYRVNSGLSDPNGSWKSPE